MNSEKMMGAEFGPDGLKVPFSSKEMADALRYFADAVDQGQVVAKMKIIYDPKAIGYQRLCDPPGSGTEYEKFVYIEIVDK